MGLLVVAEQRLLRQVRAKPDQGIKLARLFVRNEFLELLFDPVELVIAVLDILQLLRAAVWQIKIARGVGDLDVYVGENVLHIFAWFFAFYSTIADIVGNDFQGVPVCFMSSGHAIIIPNVICGAHCNQSNGFTCIFDCR